MEEITINDKRVFICEHHNQVLHFWNKFGADNPFVLTFDHHTDLKKAYQAHHYRNPDADISNLLTLILQDDDNAINLLRHDEHIDAAIVSGMIRMAFVVPLEDGMNEGERIFKLRQADQELKNQKIIVNYTPCFYQCPKMPHNDDCTIPRFNAVIETFHLEGLFRAFDRYIERDEMLENFILDIDLDYFHTIKSINPDDITFLKYLISRAKGISIAKESAFIDTWKEAHDKELSVDYLLDRIKKIISECH
ncbi:MAG: UPF0489 family protein [Bacteroidota bacterium]